MAIVPEVRTGGIKAIVLYFVINHFKINVGIFLSSVPISALFLFQRPFSDSLGKNNGSYISSGLKITNKLFNPVQEEIHVIIDGF